MPTFAIGHSQDGPNLRLDSAFIANCIGTTGGRRCRSSEPMRYLKWTMARLAGSRAERTVIVVALLLTLPSLFSGFFIDEYVQAARWRASIDHIDGKGLLDFLNDCFLFAGGKQALYQREMEHGMVAWWQAPDWKIHFWRPISAATHAVDLLLWPSSALLMHVHTLLWFLGLLCALDALYRRFLTQRAACLALALYAWDDARGQVLSWIAKRNVLIAAVFGICTIIAYDKWRRDGWRCGAWLGPLLFAVGLLSAEMGIATTGFLFAYALCLDQGSLGRRMLRLAPYCIVVVLWHAVYAAGGYGAKATVAYVHPLTEPFTYVSRLFESAPIVSLGQLTPIMSDLWGIYPPILKVVMLLLALAVLVIVGWIAWPRFADKPLARFWLIGAGLSLLPIATSGPMDCNLVFLGLGAAPSLAMLFVHAVDNPPSSRGPRFAVATLAVCNLAIAPLLLPAKCLTMLGMGFGLPATDASIPRDSAVIQKTLVAVWTISEGGLYASWNHRYAKVIPGPGKIRLLSTSLSDVSVTRLDDVTLRVRPENGFYDSAFQQLMRSLSEPFRTGDVVELSNMTALVIETTTDGRPLSVDFRFSSPLESPEWLWMRGDGMRLVNWNPPKPGDTVTVKAGF